MPFLALTAALATATAQLSPLDGRWETPSGALLELAPCGEAVCGRLISSKAIAADPAAADANNRETRLRSRKLAGLAILTGAKGGPAKWSGGTIYNPEDGKTYKSTIEVEGEGLLRVKGCQTFMGVNLCGMQQWRRAK